jgi:hypothetical protein
MIIHCSQSNCWCKTLTCFTNNPLGAPLCIACIAIHHWPPVFWFEPGQIDKGTLKELLHPSRIQETNSCRFARGCLEYVSHEVGFLQRLGCFFGGCHFLLLLLLVFLIVFIVFITFHPHCQDIYQLLHLLDHCCFFNFFLCKLVSCASKPEDLFPLLLFLLGQHVCWFKVPVQLICQCIHLLTLGISALPFLHFEFNLVVLVV